MADEHTMSEGGSGSISPAGRFQRMEDALERIESKLDAKADLVRLEALERHITDLETGRIMSPSTQQLMSQFQKSLDDIATLKRDQEVRAAALQAEKEAIKSIADTRYNSLRTMVGVASIVNAVVVVAFTILGATGVI
jgi:hypothetical protein